MHSCDNPSCVNPHHLIGGTQRDNMIDKKNKGRSAIGVKNTQAKLSENDVILIYLLDNSCKQLAHLFNICERNIRRIKSKAIWKHLLGD